MKHRHGLLTDCHRLPIVPIVTIGPDFCLTVAIAKMINLVLIYPVLGMVPPEYNVSGIIAYSSRRLISLP